MSTGVVLPIGGRLPWCVYVADEMMQNEFFKERLQPEILPALLAEGIIKPNNQRVVEGATMVERAQNALDLLRNKAVSGERLVWRVGKA